MQRSRRFSRRRAEIEAQVEVWGRDTARARQSAAVQTRRRKDYGITPEVLAPEWRARAAALGLDRARLTGLQGRARSVDDGNGFGDGLAERLVSSEGLTAEQSSFDRRDVVRAAAAAARNGATLQEIEAFVDRFIATAGVVTLAEPGALLRREDVIRRRDGRIVSAIAASPK